MIGSNRSRDDNIEKFSELEDNFFRLEDGDKVTDIAGGKCHVVIATQNGKIYGSGYTFYRHFSNCHFNSENNEDYPYELKLPEGFKAATAIWTSEKNYNMWATAVNEDGDHFTLACGQESSILGSGSTSNPNKFEKLILPSGIYFTKVSGPRRIVHGVDN